MKILSFDLGTTNIKAVIYHQNQILKEYQTTIPIKLDGLTAEQSVAFIYEAVFEMIQDAYANYHIEHAVLTTAMHSCLFLDENYEALTPLMLWSDRRGAHYINEMDLELKSYIQSINRTPVHSMTPLSKVLWAKHHNLSFNYISDIKAYLFYRLTGVFTTDYASGAASGMMNSRTCEWDETLCQRLGIDCAMLPSLAALDASYLMHEIPVKLWLGATDGVMANRGFGTEDSKLVLSMGTSIGMRYLSHQDEGNASIFSYHAGEGLWLNGTASNNGGNLYDYVKGHLIPNIEFSAYIELLLLPLPSVYCAPYVYGERGPWWEENRVVTWSKESTPEEKSQALLLGMLANLKLMYETLEKDEFDTVYVTGNLLSHRILAQRVSDVLNKKIMIVPSEQFVCEAGVQLITNQVFDHTYIKVEPQHDARLNEYIQETIEYIKKTAVLPAV